MKKIISLGLFAAVALLFAACTPTVDEVFDDSSANRATKSQSTTREVLTSQTGGWIMHYYGNLTYGGQNIWCKFDNTNVTVGSEAYGPDSTFTSHFKLEQSSGTVLSFDEYNPVFHYYSDPSNTDYGTLGKGFNGDLEFRVLSASKDSVILQGKKHGDRIVMVPAQSSWPDYYKQIQTVADSMESYNNYAVVVDNDTLNASLNYNVITVTDKATGEDTDMPFTLTPSGYELYKPVTFRGKTITGFTYSTDGIWLNPADKSVALMPIIPPINQQFVLGAWGVSLSGLSAFGQAYWNDSKTNYQDKYGEETRYAILGTYEFSANYGKNFGLSFASFDGSASWWGTLAMDYKLIGTDEVELTYNAANNVLNGNYYVKYYGYANIVYPFAWTTARRFKITTDDPKHPTYLILTDENEPKNVIKVTTRIKAWPFRN